MFLMIDYFRYNLIMKGNLKWDVVLSSFLHYDQYQMEGSYKSLNDPDTKSNDEQMKMKVLMKKKWKSVEDQHVVGTHSVSSDQVKNCFLWRFYRCICCVYAL